MKDLIDYLVEHTNNRFDRLESKIDNLNNFKWKAAGLMVSFLALAESLHVFLNRR